MTYHNLPPPMRSDRIRRGVWLLLIGSLCVALAMPLMTLWYAAHTPLSARACLWPDLQVSQTVQVVVSLPEAKDRRAIAGPWAHLHIAWDMFAMPMGTSPIDLAGKSAQDGTFAAPLRIDMVGRWWADLVLQTPGRPTWHTRVQFLVTPSERIVPASPDSPETGPPALCTDNTS